MESVDQALLMQARDRRADVAAADLDLLDEGLEAWCAGPRSGRPRALEGCAWTAFGCSWIPHPIQPLNDCTVFGDDFLRVAELWASGSAAAAAQRRQRRCPTRPSATGALCPAPLLPAASQAQPPLASSWIGFDRRRRQASMHMSAVRGLAAFFFVPWVSGSSRLPVLRLSWWKLSHSMMPSVVALGVPGVEPAVARAGDDLELVVAVEVADRGRGDDPPRR